MQSKGKKEGADQADELEKTINTKRKNTGRQKHQRPTTRTTFRSTEK